MAGGSFKVVANRRGAPLGSTHRGGHQTGGARAGAGRKPGSKNKKRIVGIPKRGSKDSPWRPALVRGDGQPPAAIFNNAQRRRASTSAAPAPTASPFDDDGSSEASSSDDDDESDDESDADAAATGAQGSASTAEARSRRDGRKLRPSPGELAYLESRMGPEVALMKAGKVPSCYVSTGGRVGSFWLRAPDPYFVLIEGAPEPEALERRDIFLWSPILLVEKLRCPFGCGGRLGVHSYVLGECLRKVARWHSCYFLYGPRLRCNGCGKTCRSWDPRILLQLPPRLRLSFPVVLFARGAVDVSVADGVLQLFMDGHGPKRIAALARASHAAAEDRLEVQYIDAWRAEGAPFPAGSTRRQPRELPSSTSAQRGDWSPSARYFSALIKSLFFERLAPMNQAMSLLSGAALAGDGCFKLLKRLQTIGGGKFFNVLYTIFNHHGMIRAQWLATGKTLELMEEGLLNMVASLKKHGLQLPQFFTTDALNQDRPFLERTLGSLTEDVAHVEGAADADGLPPAVLPSSCALVVAETVVSIEAEAGFYNTLAEAARTAGVADKQPALVLGFDIEWNVIPGPTDEFAGGAGRTACLQLASADRVSVLRVHNLVSLPPSLLALLARADVLKVGRNIAGDVSKLRRDFVSPKPVIRNTLDLGDLARSRGLDVPAQPSLTHLCRLVLGTALAKPDAVRIHGQWAGAVLPSGHAEYAALDAVVGAQIYAVLAERPVVNEPVSGAALPGQELVIRAAGDKSAIVAAGQVVPTPPAPDARPFHIEVKQHDGKTFVAVLKPGSVLVSITSVRDPSFVLDSYPLPLRAFGPPPFQAIVNLLRCFTSTSSTSELTEVRSAPPPTSSPSQPLASAAEASLCARLASAYSDVGRRVAAAAAREQAAETASECIAVGEHFWGTEDDPPDAADPRRQEYRSDSESEDDRPYGPEDLDSIRKLPLPPAVRQYISEAERPKEPMLVDGLIALEGTAFMTPASRPTRVLEDIAHVRIAFQKRTSAHHSVASTFFRLLHRIFFVREKSSWDAFAAVCKRRGIDPDVRYAERPKWAAQRLVHHVRSGPVLAAELRILFESFGPLECNKNRSRKSVRFFTAETAKWALETLLPKVLAGDFSDPAGLNMYWRQPCDAKGFIMYKTWRGSNVTEQYHDTLKDNLPGRNLGPILVDASLAFGRFRLNTNRGFKMISGREYKGHYDINLLNYLDTQRHLIWTSPRRALGFINGSSYEQTNERHGITPISPALRDLWCMQPASEDIVTAPSWTVSLSTDGGDSLPPSGLAYLQAIQGTRYPVMPVNSQAEWTLFGTLMTGEGLGKRGRDGVKKAIDTHRLTRAWNTRVNATRDADPASTLTYKVPTYLGNAFTRWSRRRSDELQNEGANMAAMDNARARIEGLQVERPAPILPEAPRSSDVRVSAADGTICNVLSETFIGIGRVLTVSSASALAGTSGIVQPPPQKTLRHPGLVAVDRGHRHCLNKLCQNRCSCPGRSARAKNGEPIPRMQCEWYDPRHDLAGDARCNARRERFRKSFTCPQELLG